MTKKVAGAAIPVQEQALHPGHELALVADAFKHPYHDLGVLGLGKVDVVAAQHLGRKVSPNALPGWIDISQLPSQSKKQMMSWTFSSTERKRPSLWRKASWARWC
jgi:hypothetical protein